jgi:hypothetical protein
MKSIRIAFVIALIAFAAGCVDQNSRREEKLVVTNNSESVLAKYAIARRDLLVCGNAVYDDPHFSAIAAHIPFNPDLSSLAQLSDPHLATAQAIALLFDFDIAFAKCTKAYLERMKTVVPVMAMITAEGYAKNEYITADLIERKLTWGDYANKRKANYDDAVQLLGHELFRVRGGTGSEADPVLRQDFSNALTRYYQSLQIVPSMHRKSAKPSS